MLSQVRKLRVSQLSKSVCLRLTQNLSTESYTEQQIKKGRPVSPHVTIYKFPITATSSILNRVTGVALSVGVTGIGALSLVGLDAPSLMTTIGLIPIIAPLAKIAISFPLIYHYLGGVRHIVWDHFPENLINTESVEKSSYLLLGTAGVASLVCAMISI